MGTQDFVALPESNLIPFAAKEMYKLIQSLASLMNKLLKSFSNFQVPPNDKLAQTHTQGIWEV